MSPGFQNSRLTGCVIHIWIGLVQQGYLFRFWFSHSIVNIWQQQQVHGKGKGIQKGRGHFLLLSYALVWLAMWSLAHWQAIPAVLKLGHTELGQVFGSALPWKPHLDLPVAEDPRTVFPEHTGQYPGTSSELDKQWVTLPSFTSQVREGSKYLTSPTQKQIQKCDCQRTKRTKGKT